MIYDRSYGIIPLKKENNSWQVFLIQHNAGHWSFPKGHAEKGESSLQAASRELNEETGLVVVKLLSKRPLEENYRFRHANNTIHKTVAYFVSLVKGEVSLQTEEVQDGRWLAFDDAHNLLSFDNAQRLLQQTLKLI